MRWRRAVRDAREMSRWAWQSWNTNGAAGDAEAGRVYAAAADLVADSLAGSDLDPERINQVCSAVASERRDAATIRKDEDRHPLAVRRIELADRLLTAIKATR